MTLCGWAALIDGLKLLEGRDDKYIGNLVSKRQAQSMGYLGRVADGLAKIYIPYQRDRRFHANFPHLRITLDKRQRQAA